ncbi:YgeY family selenium metabolism-linked hydrolase [Candidatus Bipolaricaulota bacterium]|nr:YgeY family selenium metabolism-linked hydrolase [Candidatus Bipolaricaulota bacterium]
MDRARAYQGEIVSFMSRLIQASSVSGGERDVVDVIRKEMLKSGFDEVTVDPLGNVIGRMGSGSTVVAMDAHIDTVDVGDSTQWAMPPFSGKVEDGWLYGRGAADQKGGMASMVYGMRIMRDLGLLDDVAVYVVGSVLEEDCDGLCWRYIIEEDRIRPDYVVITEPTALRIHRGQKGRIEVVVKTSGRSAHASAPERGENAVYKMAHLVSEIEALNERLTAHPILGKGTIVVSEIRSDSPSVNAVPDRCAVHIDRRLTAGETKEAALQQIGEAATCAGVNVEIVELTYDEPSYTGVRYPTEKYFPAWLEKEDAPITLAAKKAFRSVFGREAELSTWVFSTNGTVTRGVYEIPTIGFGPGDEAYAHAPNERVRIDDLISAAAFYAAFPASLDKQ